MPQLTIIACIQSLRRAACLTAAMVCAVVAGGCGDEPEPMNVVLIVIDTLRADRTSVYGYEHSTTPRLEQFAATGVAFDHAYSPSTWTRASMASIFTGLYPASHGCEQRLDGLAPEFDTLAELFKARGYTTAGVYANINIASSLGFDQGFDHYEKPVKNAGTRLGARFTDAAEINRRVFRWLQEDRPNSPWFLFALYVDPHQPYMPHPEHWFSDAYASRTMGQTRYLDSLRDGQLPNNYAQIQEVVRALYDSEIGYVDQHVGELLDELERLGLTENTAVVITADHGESLWEHDDFIGHGAQVYEVLVHVPLLMRWPGRTEAGRRVATRVSVFDVFGTLVDGIGLEPSRPPQCGSLLDAIDGRRSAQPILVQQRLDKWDYQVLVDAPYKLIQDRVQNRWELFDLAHDPGEAHNLVNESGVAASPALTSRMGALRTTLDSLTTWTEAWHDSLGVQATTAALTEQEKRELEALGY